ncbi:MAG: YitT family protein [Sediminibacterium sp.]|nr:YitT family protein [Sediminibacterium sp.]
MQFEKVQSFVIGKLAKEIPKSLAYHDVHHTKVVIHNTRLIAEIEGITGEELTILLTASLFHDTGFLESYQEHEKFSCDFARKTLPAFQYDHTQIEWICRLIMTTKMPQSAEDVLGRILCDADLLYLGTDHYFKNAKLLYKELRNQVIIKSYDEWIQYQVDFMDKHEYYTNMAKGVYTHKKNQNLYLLKTRAHDEKKRKVVAFDLGFIQDLIFITFGVLTAAFALKGFLVPNNFFDGGVTGISLLIHEIYHINLALVILVANLPFIILSMYGINYSFAIKTLVCIILLGLCLHYLPYPIITSDKLLVSIFGGFFLGLGIGLTMRAGCAVDGIEVLALYALRRSSFTISEIILALNIIIFSIAAFQFGIQTALYSMLTYFTASKTVDYVVEGIEAYTGVTIISSNSEIIKYRLVNELGRGITVYKGERGFLPGKFEVHDNCDIIFTVITRLELRKLRDLVAEIDPKAFVFASTIKEASGGIIKRRHLH